MARVSYVPLHLHIAFGTLAFRASTCCCRGDLSARSEAWSEGDGLHVWDWRVAAPRLYRAQLPSAESEGGLAQHRQPRATLPGQRTQLVDQLGVELAVGRGVLEREKAFGIALVKELLHTATAATGELDKLDGQRCRGQTALEQLVKADALAHEPASVAQNVTAAPAPGLAHELALLQLGDGVHLFEHGEQHVFGQLRGRGVGIGRVCLPAFGVGLLGVGEGAG